MNKNILNLDSYNSFKFPLMQKQKNKFYNLILKKCLCHIYRVCQPNETYSMKKNLLEIFKF